MKINSLTRAALVAAATWGFAGTALAQQPRTLKVQSAVPPSSTTQESLIFFADRVSKLTGGQLKIDALAGGAIVPPFEILDGAHKKVIDGAYGISYWWVGKNVAATLFRSHACPAYSGTSTPGAGRDANPRCRPPIRRNRSHRARPKARSRRRACSPYSCPYACRARQRCRSGGISCL